MEQMKPLLQLEHDINDPNCSCPGCDLQRAYLKRYADFKNKKTFRVFEIPDVQTSSKKYAKGHTEHTEDQLNSFKARGYEPVAFPNGLVVMRAVPPALPLIEDVAIEIERRKKENEKNDFFGYGGPIGGVQ